MIFANINSVPGASLVCVLGIVIGLSANNAVKNDGAPRLWLWFRAFVLGHTLGGLGAVDVVGFVLLFFFLFFLFFFPLFLLLFALIVSNFNGDLVIGRGVDLSYMVTTRGASPE